MNDLTIFDRVPVEELIKEQTDSTSDKESTHSLSDKGDDFLSDEEVKNNYSFLKTFKKSKKSKKHKVRPPPPAVKEEKYISD